MHLFLLIFSVLTASIVLLYLPGAAFIAALKISRSIPPALLPATSFAFSLASLALATTVSLWLKLPILYVTAVQLVLLAVCVWVFKRNSKELLHKALMQASVLKIPPSAIFVAVVTGAIAVSVGYFAWNDSAYHIGQAQKLLHLSAPSFNNTLQFPDGSAHPGYLLPLWQEAIAQVSFLSRQDPMEVAWILPGLTVSIAALTFGGFLGALTRSKQAVAPGALSWALVAALAPLPLSDAIYNSMHPGGIALAILMPLILSMIFLGCWPEKDQTHTTRSAVIVAAIATALFGILHVSNLVLLALGILGYLLIWLLRAPWPKVVIKRHFQLLGSIALVALICVVSLYPGLSKLQSFGQTAATELKQNESDMYAGKNGAPLESLLRGNVKAEKYHLRADYLVLGGALSIVGLFSLLVSAAAPRWPGSWYLIGTSFIVLLIALPDQVFPHYVDIVSLDQARRIEKSLPLAIGLGVGALTIAALLRFLIGKNVIANIFAGIIAGLSVTGLWRITSSITVMQGYGGDQIVNPRVITTALALLGVAGLLFLLLFITRLTRGEAARKKLEEKLHLAHWTWPSQMLTPGVGALASLLLLIGAWPVHARVQDMWNKQRIEYKRGIGLTQTEILPTNHRLGEMRVFSVDVANKLRKLPAKSIVLLDPRSRDPYMAMAVAPIYVVSSVPRHTANTPKNRVEERFRRAVSFYDTKNDLTDKERLQLLVDENVAAVTIHPRSALRPLMENTPGLKQIAYGKNQFLFSVDHKKLIAYLARYEKLHG